VRIDRLRGGELLAGAGGALLLGAMFLPWFGKVNPFCTPLPGFSCGRNFNAWSAFGFTDFVLLATALAGITVAIAGTNARTDSQITSASLTAPLAFGATLLVLYRLIDPVERTLDFGAGQQGLDPRIGIYFGLLGCLAVTYGGWRAVRDEEPSRVMRQDRRRPASRTRSRSSSGSRRPKSETATRRRRRDSRSR
jgi:hypothetical protein